MINDHWNTYLVFFVFGCVNVQFLWSRFLGCLDGYECMNGTCLDASVECDGILDCTEGEDEASCSKSIIFELVLVSIPHLY